MSNTEIDLARSIANAVCTVACGKARYFEHAPDGPLADGIREAASCGFLNTVGNGVVEIAETGLVLATSKDPTGYALTYLQCRRAASAIGRADEFFMILGK